jgi:hypothetical protein
VTVDAEGTTQVAKRYAIDRVALELAYGMPDRRTAHLTDDGTSLGLYLFVADRAGDLSAGTLYAARWNQRPDRDGSAGAGAADLAWVHPGHATQTEVGQAVDEGVASPELFAAVRHTDGTCAEDFASVYIGHAKPRAECLRVQPGKEVLTSRPETRRFAAMRGTTTEWRKMERITSAASGTWHPHS